MQEEVVGRTDNTSPQHVRTEYRGDPGSRILYDKLSVRTWAAILNSAPRIPPVFAPHKLGTCTRVRHIAIAHANL